MPHCIYPHAPLDNLAYSAADGSLVHWFFGPKYLMVALSNKGDRTEV